MSKASHNKLHNLCSPLDITLEIYCLCCYWTLVQWLSQHFPLYYIITVSPPQDFSSEETPWLLSLSLSHPISTLSPPSFHLFPQCYYLNSWSFFFLDLFPSFYLFHFFFPFFYTISITETIYPSSDIFFYSIALFLLFLSTLFLHIF